MTTISGAESWSRTAARAFEDELSDYLTGADPRRLGDANTVGRRAALLAVAGRIWTDRVGPFYDSAGVALLLGGITRQAVADRVRRGALLVLRTGSGQNVYPAFQFDHHGRVVSGIPDILAAFELDDVSRWTVASWFTSPDPGLDGRAPVEALRDGDLDQVRVAAHDVSTGLAA